MQHLYIARSGTERLLRLAHSIFNQFQVTMASLIGLRQCSTNATRNRARGNSRSLSAARYTEPVLEVLLRVT